MPNISLRVSEEEKAYMDSYAKTHGISLSEAIKRAFFEKLEDEYDLKLIKEYEEDLKKGNMKFYTFEETMKKLGIEDELQS